MIKPLCASSFVEMQDKGHGLMKSIYVVMSLSCLPAFKPMVPATAPLSFVSLHPASPSLSPMVLQQGMHA